MIYAIPPAIRITALGIRGVPVNTVEAATSMGGTRGQVLSKVQLPLSRRTTLLGVNQTIMFALSMVVIAGLIGGGGLGDVVTGGLSTNAALAILGGIAIVVMAMALDRSTEAVADRTDPARRHLTDRQRGLLRLATLAGAAGIGLTVVLAKVLGVAAIYPAGRAAQEWLLAKVQAALDYVQDPTTFLFSITEPLGTFIVVHLLQPLLQFLVEAPWFTTLAGVTAIAFVISGLRPAVITFLMFAAIGVMGMWEPAMQTFAQVLVATGITVLIGVALGVAAAESNTVSKSHAPDQRRAADVAAARLHHPVRVPDADLVRARHPGERPVRLPRRRCDSSSEASGTSHRTRSRRHARTARAAGRCSPRSRSRSRATPSCSA